MSNKHKRSHLHLHNGKNAVDVPVKEQSTQSWTTITVPDLWDRLKILFGAKIIVKVTTNVLLPVGASIKGVNSNSEIAITTRTHHTFEQDRPRYGLMHNPSTHAIAVAEAQAAAQKQKMPTPEEAIKMVNDHLKEQGVKMEVDKIEKL